MTPRSTRKGFIEFPGLIALFISFMKKGHQKPFWLDARFPYLNLIR
ncbi:hypothetical protein BSM4216_2733 [Bacillus smithii]|nr:hypothetical protein BSM4216_2733 [Bacillus smithii]